MLRRRKNTANPNKTAMRASMSVPGMFTPAEIDGHILGDGGLVNNLPVDVVRAMGADIVIAVDLGSDLIGRSLTHRRGAESPGELGWAARLLARIGLARTDRLPSMASVMSTSINIMQTRIARSRLAGEPADVLISPRLAHLGLMDYHRAEEAFAEGRAAVKRMLPAIEHALESP